MSRPLVTELTPAGAPSRHFPAPPDAAELADLIPEASRRAAPLDLPALDEATLVGHFAGLGLLDPVGDGADALIARAAAIPALRRFHPRQPLSTVQGALEAAHEVGRALAALTGLDRFSLQPPTVAVARRAALQIARAAFARTQPDRGEVVASIGPAATEAAELGLAVLEAPRLPSGDLDVDALMEIAGPATAAVVASWLTPSGAFERNLLAAGEVAHACGALFVVDATGLRSLAGRTRLQEAGADVCWLGLCELWAGAVSGAVGVRTALTECLPTPILGKTRAGYELDDELPGTIGRIAAGPCHVDDALAVYVRLLVLGADGLRERAERIVAAANGAGCGGRLRLTLP